MKRFFVVSLVVVYISISLINPACASRNQEPLPSDPFCVAGGLCLCPGNVLYRCPDGSCAEARDKCPPLMFICSSKFENPATKKTGISAELSICSGFVSGLPDVSLSGCELLIKGKPTYEGYIYSSDPLLFDDNKCSFIIPQAAYADIGITPEDFCFFMGCKKDRKVYLFT